MAFSFSTPTPGSSTPAASTSLFGTPASSSSQTAAAKPFSFGCAAFPFYLRVNLAHSCHAIKEHQHQLLLLQRAYLARRLRPHRSHPSGSLGAVSLLPLEQALPLYSAAHLWQVVSHQRGFLAKIATVLLPKA